MQMSDIDNKEDIDDLTAFISACDEVVSIDNVTVHIAGALGKKQTYSYRLSRAGGGGGINLKVISTTR